VIADAAPDGRQRKRQAKKDPVAIGGKRPGQLRIIGEVPKKKVQKKNNYLKRTTLKKHPERDVMHLSINSQGND